MKIKVYTIGMQVRIGGKKGDIMTITQIQPNGEMTLKSESGMSTFYFKPGDCTLYKYQKYEQLTLF